MRLQQLLAPAFLSASALADTLSNTLQDSGFTLFQQQLQSNPELLNSKEPGLVVYAPTDSGLSSSEGPGRVRRQLKYQNGYYFSGEQSQRYPLPSSFDRRMVTRNLQSGGDARMTFLDDTAYVNLGWVNNQSLVERPAGGKRQVYTGLGGNVNVAGNDIPFDNGVIRPIDGVQHRDLTLPESISSTLPHLGVDKFHDLVKKSGLLSLLDSTAGITVLAPDNSAFKNVTKWSDTELIELIKGHILVNFPAYTPLLKDGLVYPTLAGSKVKVTVREGTIYLNGAKILAGDAIAVNGAVHTIDRVLATFPGTAPVPEQTQATVPTHVPEYVPTGAGMAAESLSWKALALSVMGVVAATRYWM
ncbi:FAS1 domain-containing protein [Fusarium solani]|uniref:FAS1 domain-containing protein n=1 Tax=Fusarium solani TaxID=169388 RepID=A0A9P9HW99_FUSSL|nr:FAS1 domain-containing protein [Fusarium solani]KAH7264353.1 FAS1 domain-containing protein [Fusarium solani]